MGFRGMLVLLCLAVGAIADELPPACPPAGGVALQVLGSGGPVADDGRSSTAYLVWMDGRSRVLIDAGGGSFLRFGEAGADFPELAFVGLSHFHTDHSADFPALLKSGYFSGRERPLTVAGPGAGGPFPGLEDWLASLFVPGSGAYGYLGGYLDGTGGLARLDRVEVRLDSTEAIRVFRDRDGDLDVDAIPVPHGIVPALGFRVSIGGRTLVFASDQNGSEPAFSRFAAGADVLVMHMAVPENATGVAVELHAKPSRLAAIAEAAAPARLVLAHLMARSLRDLEGNVAIVREGFTGEVVVAEDLDCLLL